MSIQMNDEEIEIVNNIEKRFENGERDFTEEELKAFLDALSVEVK
jgi:hypothetical protein